MYQGHYHLNTCGEKGIALKEIDDGKTNLEDFLLPKPRSPPGCD